MMQAPNPRAFDTTKVDGRSIHRPQVGRAAKFFFDGVDHAVSARVAAVDGESLTLRQELPFLRLNGQLSDERGRSAQLTSVAVAVRDGTPSLVLEVRYQSPRKERRDQTQPYRFDTNLYTERDPIPIINDEALRGDAPATPLTPLSIPSPKPVWRQRLWQRIRMFFASLRF